jgi:hypothetical protein
MLRPQCNKIHFILRQSSSASRLGLSLLLLFLFLLSLLLLLLVLLLILTLQILDLLFRLGNRLEESLQSGLLRGFQVLLQPSSTASNPVLAESLLRDKKLDKSINVGRFPFEITVCMIGGTDVGVEEELASVDIGPIFWDLKLGFSGFDGFDELLESAVFAD